MATHGLVEVSALRIRDGQRVAGEPDELGNIGICHCGRDKGSLYVLVNAEGQSTGDMEETLAMTIIESFQQSSNSVTGALLDAIQAANAVLYEDNKMSFGPQRVQAGVYCAVVRPNHDLVLGYAGPAVALVVGLAGVERMYSELDAVAGRGRALESDLGVRPRIEVSLYSSRFNPGDILVLGSPSLLECGLDDEEMANALTEAGADGLADDHDMTALVLRYPAGAAAQALRSGAPAEAQPEAATTAATRPGSSLVAAAQSAASKVTALFNRPARASKPDATPVAPVAPAVAEESAADDIPLWLSRETETRRERRRNAARGIKLPQLNIPNVGISRVQIAAIVGIIALIAAAIWWQGHSAAQARERKFQTLISQAEKTRSLGQASLDRSQAMTYLSNAQDLVTQALAIKPDAGSALALRDSIARDMDETKGLTRLATSQVTTLYTFTAAGTGPGRVVGDGFNLYVLDKGDQKVYKFVLNQQGNGVVSGGESVLLRKGDQIGGKVVGDLVDIAWAPAGGNRRTANLLILESGGSLIQYDVTKGLSVLPVKDTSTWRKVQATGGYSGNFYVLDNLSSVILRYHPTTRGYDEAPTNYLQTKIDLASAVDMAIDGDIFVLMVNGQVIWLSSGRPQAYSLEGLDRPLSAPVAIFTNEGSQSVYVADPSNARVVKLSKQGVVQKQIAYDEGDATFQRLRGVFADEKKLCLYVTAGTKLLQIAIP